MPLFTKDKKCGLFIHIPKTAGTSLEVAFLGAGYKYEYLHRPGKGDGPDQKPCNSQHWHHELIQKEIYPVLEKRPYEFTIVRNPFTRMISEMMWKNNAKSNFSKDDFFMHLDSFGCSGMRTYKRDPFYADNHWRPQHHFVGPNTNIFKYEELQHQAWADLRMRFGLENLGTEFTNVSLDRPRPTRMKIEPSKEFRELYTELYAEDHKRFDYGMPFDTGDTDAK